MAQGQEKPQLRSESGPTLNELERVVYGVLVPAMEAARINPENFKHYDPETVKRNLEYTAKLVADNSKDNNPYKEHAELAEAIIWDQINSGAFMGTEAKSIVPSKYEDITKGVDSIVRFEKKTGVAHLALAIDVTESAVEVDRKIEAILGDLQAGKLTTLEYFESKSQHGIGYQGMLENIPKVVVASGRKSVRAVAERIAKLWNLSEKATTDPQSKAEIEKLKRAISKSQLKFKMLFEIRAQLIKYADYATQNNHPELAGPHQRALAIIIEILNSEVSLEKQGDVLKTLM